jgi:hypothetical protein
MVRFLPSVQLCGGIESALNHALIKVPSLFEVTPVERKKFRLHEVAICEQRLARCERNVSFDVPPLIAKNKTANKHTTHERNTKHS